MSGSHVSSKLRDYPAASEILAFMRKLLAAAILLLALLPLAGRAQTAPSASDLVQAELVAEPRAIEPGRPFTVGIRLRMAEHWHTYWRNPGDSGLATEISWTLPPGFSAGPIQWPSPSRIPIGPLVNYGYEDETVLLVEITPPADFGGAKSVELKALVNYLVCERECIPGEAQLSTRVPTAAPGQGGMDPASRYIFEAARASLPVPFEGRATLRQGQGAELLLHLEGGQLASAKVSSAYFFPAEEAAIETAAPQMLTANPSGLSLSLQRSSSASGPVPDMLAGVLAIDEKAGDAVRRRSFQIGSMPAAPAGSGAAAVSAPKPAEAEAPALLWAAFFAFLGGLVLNLMPCVFPVLSIKVLSLVQYSGRSPGSIRAAGLAYAAGVVMSFLALAGLLLAVRAGGQEVGWGFQLQSPALVLALAFLLFCVGLSLSGIAEFGVSIAGRAGALKERSGLSGSFLTGILAALVATPCTAPFMGAAVGYAVTASVPVALAVFGALGLGLAAPFLLLTIRPSLLFLLPRPGAWMNTLKQFLAFPVYATVAWLLFVLAQQVDANALLGALIGLVLLAFAFWCWRLAGEREGFARRLAQGLAVLAFCGVAGIGWLATGERSPGVAATAGAGQESFSQARLDQLRAEGRPVFLNMTAAWCITCLVNERAVLSSAAVRDALEDRGIVYLKGDWTNQNPEITRLLARHGRNGVPLYVLYPPRGEPVVLPQLLTQAGVLGALAQVPLVQAASPARRAEAAIR